jgi:hypothetical protein
MFQDLKHFLVFRQNGLGSQRQTKLELGKRGEQPLWMSLEDPTAVITWGWVQLLVAAP